MRSKDIGCATNTWYPGACASVTGCAKCCSLSMRRQRSNRSSSALIPAAPAASSAIDGDDAGGAGGGAASITHDACARTCLPAGASAGTPGARCPRDELASACENPRARLLRRPAGGSAPARAAAPALAPASAQQPWPTAPDLATEAGRLTRCHKGCFGWLLGRCLLDEASARLRRAQRTPRPALAAKTADVILEGSCSQRGGRRLPAPRLLYGRASCFPVFAGRSRSSGAPFASAGDTAGPNRPFQAG